MSKLNYEKVASLELAIREVSTKKGKVEGLYLVNKVDGLNDIILWMSPKGLKIEVVYNASSRTKNFELKSAVAKYSRNRVELKEVKSLLNGLSKEELKKLSINLPVMVSEKRLVFFQSLFIKRK